MAGRDGDEPKEGVDFKWVKAENSNAMVRKFFTKADKAAAKAPAKVAPKKTKPAAKAAPKTEAKSPTKAANSVRIPVDIKPTSTDRTRASNLGMGPRIGSKTLSERIADAKVKTADVLAATGPTKPGINYETWKNMSRSERKKADLPTSEIGAQLYFKRFQEGVSGPKMAKGGMVKGKKK